MVTPSTNDESRDPRGGNNVSEEGPEHLLGSEPLLPPTASPSAPSKYFMDEQQSTCVDDEEGEGQWLLRRSLPRDSLNAPPLSPACINTAESDSKQHDSRSTNQQQQQDALTTSRSKVSQAFPTQIQPPSAAFMVAAAALVLSTNITKEEGGSKSPLTSLPYLSQADEGRAIEHNRDESLLTMQMATTTMPHQHHEEKPGGVIDAASGHVEESSTLAFIGSLKNNNKVSSEGAPESASGGNGGGVHEEDVRKAPPSRLMLSRYL